MNIKVLENAKFPLRPRVRITSYCNRRCQYCFAQDYLTAKREDSEISLEYMEKIIQLCKDDGINMIAWQGGEPLLYSKLQELVELHKKYNMQVMLFTNALIDPMRIKLLCGVVKKVLINCNEPNTYLEDEWELLNNNIELLKQILSEDNVAIGINIYHCNMDTEFIVNLANQHKIKEVRLDMTRPEPSRNNEFIDFHNVNDIFKVLKATIYKLEKAGVKIPHLDCPFPLCTLSEEDREFSYKYIHDDVKYGVCRTGLDFTTDAKVSSCFCSMPIKDVSIDEFDGIWHAWLTNEYNEDKIRWERATNEECEYCTYHINRICQGGCLGYKTNCNEFIDKIGYKKLLRELPNNYLGRLGKAYKLLFTGEIQEGLKLSEDLYIEFKYERTIYLRAVAAILCGSENQEEYITDAIDTSSFPAIRAMEFGRILIAGDRKKLCKKVLENTFNKIDYNSVGYEKILYGLIEICKREKQWDDIYKYLKFLRA